MSSRVNSTSAPFSKGRLRPLAGFKGAVASEERRNGVWGERRSGEVRGFAKILQSRELYRRCAVGGSGRGWRLVRSCARRRIDFLLRFGIPRRNGLHQPLPGLLLRGARGLANRNLEIGDLLLDLVAREHVKTA
jgi:hypothetical protein